MAGGAVVMRRGAGKPATARKTSAKKNKHKPINKKIWQHLPHTQRFPKPANKSNNTMADMHIYIYNTMADNHIYFNLCTTKDNINTNQMLLELIVNL
jgi:hypothetical protein